MFIYSGAKRSYSATHVLSIARTGNEVHYIAGSKRSEMFHVVYGGSNRRLERFRFLTSAKVMHADIASFTGIITLSFWKKGCFIRRSNNVM